jgi:hypothetical protein
MLMNQVRAWNVIFPAEVTAGNCTFVLRELFQLPTSSHHPTSQQPRYHAWKSKHQSSSQYYKQDHAFTIKLVGQVLFFQTWRVCIIITHCSTSVMTRSYIYSLSARRHTVSCGKEELPSRTTHTHRYQDFARNLQSELYKRISMVVPSKYMFSSWNI